ncbi:NUDIX domain-containing protein [Candidatus Dependentiae bacterium]|jgi:8-oxo-dGTP diphosphatase|nr:NUDIX domain-containing protein [Candidatus Dependentiae bacterium]
MSENTNIHTLARAVIIDQGHILLAHHPSWKQGHYYLPGGHIEHGESAQQTVLRELDEEMGIAFTLQRFVGCLEYSFQPNLGARVCHTHEYNFLFLATSPELKAGVIPAQKEEHVAFAWAPLESLSSINLLPEPLTELIPAWCKLDLVYAFTTKMIEHK